MIMTNHPYRAPRRGHLPQHIRDMFRQAINAFVDSTPGAPLPLMPYEIRYRQRRISIAETCRVVWNCDDNLPGDDFGTLHLCLRDPPADRTYAAAARALLHELQRTGQVNTGADIARRRLYDARDAAWHALEGRIFAEIGGEGGGGSPDRGARDRVSAAATTAVEQWRKRGRPLPMTNLERLLQSVVAAEDAIVAAQKP
jgi:hypothetical protein